MIPSRLPRVPPQTLFGPEARENRKALDPNNAHRSHRVAEVVDSVQHFQHLVEAADPPIPVADKTSWSVDEYGAHPDRLRAIVVLEG